MQINNNQAVLDIKAIAFFCAAGFFPEKDTYSLNQKYQYPQNSEFADKFNAFYNFDWYYDPRKISLSKAVIEFAELFESIVEQSASNKKVILPLSGGLDSRTLAAALKRTGKTVNSYSYSFRNGHDENKYGNSIARVCGFPFTSLIIEKGYLWDKIEQLAEMNKCYSEFTHPRQMAFTNEYKNMGEVFMLGHWGDVVFDNMNVDDNLSDEAIIHTIKNKITKKGGKLLASNLWQEWGLEETFDEYYDERISSMFKKIKIKNSANATIRAFKSKYWAPRWTASNFCIFESAHPVQVPYFNIKMNKFVCGIPESLLTGRQIQIEYLKKYAPQLANIPWQAHKPFNLHNYHFNRVPWNLPYRLFNKIKREINRTSGNPIIQRNWELQFLGRENESQLKDYLFNNKQLEKVIPLNITTEIFNNFFKIDSVKYSHPLSTLLTIALFAKQNLK